MQKEGRDISPALKRSNGKNMKKRQTRLNVILLILIFGIVLTVFFDVKLFRESTRDFVAEHPYLMNEEDEIEEVMIGTEKEESSQPAETSDTPDSSDTPNSSDTPEPSDTQEDPSGQTHGAGIFSDIFGN